MAFLVCCNKCQLCKEVAELFLMSFIYLNGSLALQKRLYRFFPDFFSFQERIIFVKSAVLEYFFPNCDHFPFSLRKLIMGTITYYKWPWKINKQCVLLLLREYVHLIHLSSSCVPAMLLFYKVNSSTESIWFFFFFSLVRILTGQKAIEIHLDIVLEELFSSTTLNKLLVWKMK